MPLSLVKDLSNICVETGMIVTLGMVTVTTDIYWGNSGLVAGHQLVAEMDIGGRGVREARDTGTEAIKEAAEDIKGAADAIKGPGGRE